MEIESPEDSGYGRAQITGHISCIKCAPLYTYWPNSNVLVPNAETAQKRELDAAARRLAAPIQGKLVDESLRLFTQLGRRSAQWHPTAMQILDAPSELGEFRKELKARGNLLSWLMSQIVPSRFCRLVEALKQDQLLPLLTQFLEADQTASAFIVSRIVPS
ncbi:MAG TPA: hypothetical protein VNG33_19305 [Polyangiaceae bacterium]|nr:hypothetical protein [Polyangiaceae bacterium]